MRSMTCGFTDVFEERIQKLKAAVQPGRIMGWCGGAGAASQQMNVPPCHYSLRQLWDAGMLHLTLKSFLTVPVVPLWTGKGCNEHGKRRGCKG